MKLKGMVTLKPHWLLPSPYFPAHTDICLAWSTSRVQREPTKKGKAIRTRNEYVWTDTNWSCFMLLYLNCLILALQYRIICMGSVRFQNSLVIYAVMVLRLSIVDRSALPKFYISIKTWRTCVSESCIIWNSKLINNCFNPSAQRLMVKTI